MLNSKNVYVGLKYNFIEKFNSFEKTETKHLSKMPTFCTLQVKQKN